MKTDSPPTGSVSNSDQGPYKVPQRFDLATVFVVTLAYALLLGLLRALGAPTFVQATIVAVLTIVGAVQMFAPPRHVRIAAIATGVVAYAVTAIAIFSQQGNGMIYPAELLCGAFTIGSSFGYICGTVVAGVFLVSEYARSGIKRVMKEK